MKFMVCYDGTKMASSLLNLALTHAEVWRATVEIVEVVTRTESMKHSKVERMEWELEREVKDISGSHNIPYNVQLLLTDMEAGEALLKFAKDEKIDQIYIGSLIKSRVKKLVFKSSARYVILNASCPVVSLNKQWFLERAYMQLEEK